MSSQYKRARVIFDGYISETERAMYLYTDVPDGLDPESHTKTQVGVLRPSTPGLVLTIDYKSVRKVEVA